MIVYWGREFAHKTWGFDDLRSSKQSAPHKKEKIRDLNLFSCEIFGRYFDFGSKTVVVDSILSKLYIRSKIFIPPKEEKSLSMDSIAIFL